MHVNFTLILKLMTFCSRRADPPKGFPSSSSSETCGSATGTSAVLSTIILHFYKDTKTHTLNCKLCMKELCFTKPQFESSAWLLLAKSPVCSALVGRTNHICVWSQLTQTTWDMWAYIKALHNIPLKQHITAGCSPI